MSEPLSPPPAAPPEPIIPALEQRARDLSMAIVNPKLDGDSSGSATLGATWVRTTEKGWRVSVGVEARAAIWDEAVEERVKSGAYSVGASFSVTVAR